MPGFTAWGNASHARSRLDATTGERRRFLDQHDGVANLGLDWWVAPLSTTFGIAANWVSGYDQTVRAMNGTRQHNDVDSATRLDLSSRSDLGHGISLSLSVLNVLGETERRTDSTFDATGAPSARSTTSENTYRSVYLRIGAAF